MIKRANQKKKKGFSLIELIIVLAVMAIIALIAIPNFTAVRNNSKFKADTQSCETIKRAVMMLAADDSITGSGDITVSFTNGLISGVTNVDTIKPTGAHGTEGTAANLIKEALAEVKEPQSNKATGTKKELIADTQSAKVYTIVINNGSVEVVTGAKKS